MFGGSRVVTEAAKNAGTFLGGSVLAYAAHVAAQSLDTSMNSANVWTRPSSLVVLGGAVGLPVLAVYHKGGSARSKMIELGAAAYFLPQAIQLARSMMSTQRVSFRPAPMAMPVAAYAGPASYSVGSTIF